MSTRERNQQNHRKNYQSGGLMNKVDGTLRGCCVSQQENHKKLIFFEICLLLLWTWVFLICVSWGMCQQSSDFVPLAVVLSLLRGISDKLAVGRSPGHLTKALPCYLGVPPTFHPWSTHLLPLFCSYLFPSSSHLLPTCMAIFSLCSWIFSFPLFPSVFCPSFPNFLPCSAHA